MPNYDPAILAQALRNKVGSAMTPAEAQAMGQQQQQQAMQQMRQQAGAAVTPAEMGAMQRMAPMPQVEPRAQTSPMPQVAPQNSMGVAPVAMPEMSRQEALRQAMQQRAGSALSPYEMQQLQMRQQGQ